MSKMLKAYGSDTDLQVSFHRDDDNDRIHFCMRIATGPNYGIWNQFATFWPKGVEKYPKNFACLNYDYIPEITEWIEKNKLGKFTGKYIGELPLFEWDENELKKYEFRWCKEDYLKNVMCGNPERKFNSSVKKKPEDEYMIHLKKI